MTVVADPTHIQEVFVRRDQDNGEQRGEPHVTILAVVFRDEETVVQMIDNCSRVDSGS